MTDRALLQQALEALEEISGGYSQNLIAALRERLAQPEQEPVAWRWKERINGDFDSWVISASEPPPYAIEQQPLYTAPPQRKPLTDEEIERACVPLGAAMLSFTEVARAIEAAHGIKGKA